MIIETERLILRPFLESDAENMFEYLHESTVSRFTCMKLNSHEDAKEEVKNCVNETEYDPPPPKVNNKNRTGASNLMENKLDALFLSVRQNDIKR